MIDSRTQQIHSELILGLRLTLVVVFLKCRNGGVSRAVAPVHASPAGAHHHPAGTHSCHAAVQMLSLSTSGWNRQQINTTVPSMSTNFIK